MKAAMQPNNNYYSHLKIENVFPGIGSRILEPQSCPRSNFHPLPMDHLDQMVILDTDMSSNDNRKSIRSFRSIRDNSNEKGESSRKSLSGNSRKNSLIPKFHSAVQKLIITKQDQEKSFNEEQEHEHSILMSKIIIDESYLGQPINRSISF